MRRGRHTVLATIGSYLFDDRVVGDMVHNQLYTLPAHPSPLAFRAEGGASALGRQCAQWMASVLARPITRQEWLASGTVVASRWVLDGLGPIVMSGNRTTEPPDRVVPVPTQAAGRGGSLHCVSTIDPLTRLRAICGAFPEVTERPSHGAPTWFVRDRKTFGTFWVDGHHHEGFPHLTLAATLPAQAELLAADPARFFRPPYVGHRGWVGIRIDDATDWGEIAELCEEAYRLVAPATLLRLLPPR